MNTYYDKNGKSINEGDLIRWDNGKENLVYSTVEDELGTDATNPVWIDKGWAVPGEFGIYPFAKEDMKHIEVIESNALS